MTPTKEQRVEFWEWCGLEITKEYSLASKMPVYLTKDSNGFVISLPRIDLNNLFKYAVPRLDEDGYVFTLYRFYTIKYDFKTPDEYGFGVKVFKYGVDERNHAGKPHKNPALALFWAIYEVVKSGR